MDLQDSCSVTENNCPTRWNSVVAIYNKANIKGGTYTVGRGFDNR
jgi:hypothetical protein